MTSYNTSDAVSMDDFPYAWRVTDERWALLPNEVLARIQPLSLERGKQVARQGSVFRHSGPFYVNIEHYHVVEACSLETRSHSEGGNVRQWLSQLPINPQEQVYVSWGNNAAVATDWITFSMVWENLWYPFDVLDVFDDSLNWAVLFGPEEFAVFIKPGAVVAQSKTYEHDAGHSLVRAFPPTV